VNCMYVDTRGALNEPVAFTQAIVDGLAQGGGLYVPTELPELSLDTIVGFAKLPYWQRAAEVYRAFGVDIESETIDKLMQSAYGEQFDTADICPITSLDEKTHVLELWHGPTAAFKDMALQCLPRFFSQSAAQLREAGKLDSTFMILVATSGDTGSAALEGFCDVDGVSIGVLYPHGGVSDIQHRQMATMRGANTYAWAVRGNFDDCQSSVKAIFDDEAFAKELKETYGIELSSANSINWGRLLPQVVYYVDCYSQLVAKGSIAAGEPIDVCVPTGNFGNILACWYAKQIGTPIANLICASNQNRVLTDFLTTGTYDISDRTFVLTPSPSMDILISSNLERQLFELSGRNAQAVAGWMQSLKAEKRFTVDADTLARFQEVYRCGWASNATCLATIKDVYDAHHYLLDPHTAVAYRVAQEQRSERPVVIASTAHWAKFGPNVYRALHELAPEDTLPAEVAALSGCELNKLIARESQLDYLPAALAGLDQKELRFTDVIDARIDDIKGSVCTFLEKIS